MTNNFNLVVVAVGDAMCYWSHTTVHNRCVERVVMDNILGCPLFGPHKRRLSSQQFKKLCACVSCLSSNCSLRVLAVRFDLIRFDLIASFRRVSHWSAQDPFYFFRWFLFFKCLGRRFNKVHVLAEMLGFLGLREAVLQ